MPTCEEILADCTLIDPLVDIVVDHLDINNAEDGDEIGVLFGCLAMRLAASFTEEQAETEMMIELLKQGIDTAYYG